MKKHLSILLCLTAALTASAQQQFKGYDFQFDGLFYNITGENTVELTVAESNCDPYPVTVNVPAVVDHDGVTYTVTRIGDNAFSVANTRRVTLPATIEEIGYAAFAGLSIAEITLPDALRSIGLYAFASCGYLTELHLPANVSHIDGGAFASSAINTFTLDDANTSFRIVDGLLYNADTTVLVASPALYTTDTLQLPSTLRRIEACAFSSSTLWYMMLPDGLREIGEGAFPRLLISLHLPASVCRIEGNPIGENPADCLTITIDEGNSHYLFADSCLTSADGDTLLLVVDATGDYRVPDGVKVLANDLFANNNRLSSVTLPEGLTDIGDAAFYNTRCNVNLPSTLRTIGSQAFMRNTGLRDVALPASLRRLGSEAFSNSRITSVVLPDSLKVVERETFYLCTNLTGLQVGSCLEHVHYRAFYYNTHLDAIPVMPRSLHTVGMLAFYGIQGDANKYVEFEDAPDTIGTAAFNTTKVRFHSTVPPVLFPNAFWNTDTVVVPCGYGSVYAAAEGWQELNIVEDCEAIGDGPDSRLSVAVDGRTLRVTGADCAEMQLYDIDGRMLYAGPSRPLTLPAPGAYLLRIHTPAGECTKKLIVR